MSADRVQRRLAAIVAVDVVGYSKMMGRDEAGTLVRLKQLRAQFLHPNVQEHGGRIVKTTGDGTLVEFPSAFDAVSHAVDVQRGMADRNSGLPEDEQIHLRFGINVGDVLVDEDDIYGDGVNVAARLEALADSGGICLSARVYDYVRDRLDVTYEDLGERTVKNIAEPVRIYRVRLSESHPTGRTDRPAALPLPDKPSIAVLPFANMSGDPEQEYFADGITEDLITALSRIRWFFVIARNSCFAYKGQSPDIRDVARELGRGLRARRQRSQGRQSRSRHGAVDRRRLGQSCLGPTLRPGPGRHLRRAGRNHGNIGRRDRARARQGRARAGTGEASRRSARLGPLSARPLAHLQAHPRGSCRGAALFRQAIEIDPGLARAYAAAEEAFFFQFVGGYVDTGEAAKADALRFAEKAVQLDGQDAFNRYALGRALSWCDGTTRPSLSFARRSSSIQALLRPTTPLPWRLPPADTRRRPCRTSSWRCVSARKTRISDSSWYDRAEACLFLGRLEEAVEAAERSLREPNIQWSRWAILAAAQAHLGRLEEARRSIEALHPSPRHRSGVHPRLLADR